MRYHTLVINLCSHDIDPELSSVRESGQYSNPVSVDNAEDSIQAALSSARDIAFLVQLYRTEYGMDFAHPFVMYAISVSLFLLLTQKDFDILDCDFLSLTTAFSVISCRSRDISFMPLKSRFAPKLRVRDYRTRTTYPRE